MSSVITLEDGRVFPALNGRALSWSIGSGTNPQEYRAIAEAMKEHRPDQYHKEVNGLRRDTMNPMFGRNAQRILDAIGEKSKSITITDRLDSLSGFQLGAAYVRCCGTDAHSIPGATIEKSMRDAIRKAVEDGVPEAVKWAEEGEEKASRSDQKT